MPARLEISSATFRGNVRAVAERIAPSELMLVMKDDAYGHGLNWAAAQGLAVGVRWFGAYEVPAALRIRAAAPEARIFAWATSSREEVAAAIRADVDLGIGAHDYLRRVVAEARSACRPARIHLKIDTGLHRNGIRPEDWDDVVAEARRAEDAGLVRIAGVWSHLGEASDADDDDARSVFTAAGDALRAAGGTPEHRHLTASAASWARPELRGSLGRIGAFCYGIRSADGPDLDGVAPAAALRADVIDSGADGVRIDIGALDGLPSTLAGAAIGDRSARIVRVDRTWTEVSSSEELRPGDSVTLFGPGGVSATDLAEHIDTVGEEILTRISPLVPRIYT
ncbi:alanine racemase [Microbacterium pseudoresistens]|uniref:Alanine racemase n=1 Tax=Microbacterium pseudoresistens TaxID=640634 RepID=A0A7Y9JN54_9MICO|nr:alanine racemase [Microbacterium pseudoresistens]NYD55537.1 alanine racemase [Microbacterium pseudoresistens]